MGPALPMRWNCIGRKSAVLEAEKRSAVFWLQVYLDERRPRRDFLTIFPAPRVRQPRHGYHLSEFAAPYISLLHVDQQQTARPCFERWRGAYPADQPLRIGEKRKHRGRFGIDRH